MLRKKEWLGELTIPIDWDVKHQTKQTKLGGFHSACFIIFRAFLKIFNKNKNFVSMHGVIVIYGLMLTPCGNNCSLYMSDAMKTAIFSQHHSYFKPDCNML